ncbi:hypothetical protein [Jatrophihabitans lederbergiae]|uniref:HPt domain-containing protein n=1 Tax=Jatrophihabitans lederbergiae TaxID=3075547 RepID=A0ABU2JCZ7_9ACTN|nr:hypothetical protein [Jatrophihabitans sp. DSM 44399]MDT0262339.1 hypothetical protein [Jatrophihabitans sp. DSM 44399]
MRPPDTDRQPDAGELTAGEVGDLFETVSAANGRMAREVHQIIGSRAAVSQAPVDRFTRLADELRPGPAARAQLGALDAELLAGTAVWTQHRRGQAGTAAERTEVRWSGGLSA